MIYRSKVNNELFENAIFIVTDLLNQKLWPFWLILVNLTMTSHKLFSNHVILVANFEKQIKFHLI